MTEEFRFLNYPTLEKYHILCEQYLKSRINWDEISEEISEKGASYFSVSDVVSLFPHLELDENYELICYLSREYHGIWGRVAAIKNDADFEPVVSYKKGQQISLLFGGGIFKLPESAAPPMESLYHDGTDEGLLEAVLCSFLLEAIPYLQFENRKLKLIMDNPPLDLNEQWNTIVHIKDWRPRRVKNSIIAFKRKIEDGFGSSDGKDRIYLTQFSFKSDLRFYLAFELHDRHSMYKSHIEDDKRYNGNRHCCVFAESSVIVAEEK